jgi:hypothetical protein
MWNRISQDQKKEFGNLEKGRLLVENMQWRQDSLKNEDWGKSMKWRLQ